MNNLTNWKVKKEHLKNKNSLNINDLNNEGWILLTSELEEIYRKIYSQSKSLEDFTGAKNIFNGIQTSRNDMYVITPYKEDDTCLYFENSGKKWKVEKEITRPYYKTPSTKCDDSLNTYKLFKPNSFVIFPYEKQDGKLKFITISALKEKFPNAYTYLTENKEKFVMSLKGGIRDIKPNPKSSDEWYRYGRQQSLDIGEIKEKIVVGILSKGEKYAVDHNKTLLSSGGTAGYCMITLPEDSKYSIYYLQAILNSKYVELNTVLLGEIFRGGYIARGTKVLKKLPVREIDFNDKKEKELYELIVLTQQELIKIQSQIDKNSHNKREKDYYEKEFHILKEKLDNALRSLYSFSEEEDKKISNIKELYETTRECD